MASNPTPTPASSISVDRAGEIVGTITSIAATIEQLIAASGVTGGQSMPQVEQLTALFGDLAGVAIRAFHDVAGKPVSPDSVLALMPAATPLADPPSASPAGA